MANPIHPVHHHVEEETSEVLSAADVKAKVGTANCGCHYHAEEGIPCVHDLAAVRDAHGTDEYCPKAPDHLHHAVLSSLVLHSDGGEYYLDVTCQYCGRGGCCAGSVTLVDLIEETSW